MKTVWITGARGFIGRHLARKLAGDGSSVMGLGHGAWPAQEALNWGVSHWINGEISQANLDRLLAGSEPPAAVYHLAGGSVVGASLRTPEEDFRRTVGSSVEILEWIRNRSAQTPLVLTSSAAVYGAGHSGPIRETAVSLPYSPYGYHKRMAELLCESYGRNFGLRTAVVRLFSVYGPGLQKQLLWDLCGRLEGNPPELVLGGSGGELRDWLHVSDAAAYLMAAAKAASADGFIVNGGTGIAASVREIAEHVCHVWKALIPLSFTGEARSGDPFSLLADPTRAHELHRPAVDWRSGIAEYIDWYRRNRVH